jgi:hypothetical protein
MSKTDDEVAALRAEVADLKARVEARANPPAPPPRFEAGPRGPTTSELAISRVGMSPETKREFASAVPTGVVRQIVGDGPVGKLAPAGAEGNARPSVAQLNTSGWRTAQPLSNPPGVAQADRLMDEQDRRDRVELAQRLARQKVVEGKG